MWTIDSIIEHSQTVAAFINDKWVPARPLPQPFRTRVKHAWLVLTGRADAFTWPNGQ